MSYCHMNGLDRNPMNEVVKAIWKVSEMRVLPLRGGEYLYNNNSQGLLNVLTLF